MNWPDFFDNTLNRLYTLKGIVSVIVLSLIIWLGVKVYFDVKEPPQNSCTACEKERDDYKTALLQVSKMLSASPTSYLQNGWPLLTVSYDTVPEPLSRGQQKKVLTYIDSILNKYKQDSTTKPPAKKTKGGSKI